VDIADDEGLALKYGLLVPVLCVRRKDGTLLELPREPPRQTAERLGANLQRAVAALL